MARKRIEPTSLVLTSGGPYELRDLDGTPITERAAKALIVEQLSVDPEIRDRTRAHSAASSPADTTTSLTPSPRPFR